MCLQLSLQLLSVSEGQSRDAASWQVEEPWRRGFGARHAGLGFRVEGVQGFDAGLW